MPCIKPLNAVQNEDGVFFDLRTKGREIKLACGQCIGCRLEKARQWSIRIMHEASLHEKNSFITLTYNDEKLPEGQTLRYKDIQKFYKRLRKKYNIRHFTCGEYGEQTKRPHYHACIFGENFDREKIPIGKNIYTNPEIEKIWGMGNVGIGELTIESANYVARYNLKKITGDKQMKKKHYETLILETGEIIDREPETVHMSLKPAIGLNWLRLYWQDVKNGTCIINGHQSLTPKYYRAYFRKTEQKKIIDENIEIMNYERTINERRNEQKIYDDMEKILNHYIKRRTNMGN